MNDFPFIFFVPPAAGWGISEWRDLLEAIAAVATIIGIGVAGGWSYLLFIKNRGGFPCADLSQEVDFKNLTPERTLVHVTLSVKNLGKVLLPIDHVWTKIFQISPLPEGVFEALNEGRDPEYHGESTIKWPEIKCRQTEYGKNEANIEPGEMQKFDFDFVIDSNIKTIEVYSYFTNISKPNAGWCETTIIDNTERR